MTIKEHSIFDQPEVMIVDDLIENLNLLSELLLSEFYKVRPSNSGELALLSIAKKQPDIILLDIKMPVLDGFEVCRRLKKDEVTKNIPIIFISALDDAEEKLKGFELGAVDYITKPFDKREVIMRIKNHLELRKLQLKTEESNYELTMEIKRRLETEKQLKIALAESEDLYDNAPCGYHNTDKNGYFINMNNTELNWLGYKRDEIVGKKCVSDIITEEYKDRFKTTFPLLKEQGFINNIEFDYVRNDGSNFPVIVNALAMYDEEGNYLKSKSTVHDITKLKNMERILFEEKEQLQITFKSIGDGIITTDVNRNVLNINNVAEKLTGWTIEEAKGKSFSKVFNISNTITGEDVINPVEEVLRTDTICELANHTVLTSKDGTQRHVADTAAPIKDANGNTTGVVIVFRDITEKKQYMDKIEHLSYHDYLTGLYNRAYFKKELDLMDREELLPISIIMGDVNGLKFMNDVYGHEAGDNLLKRIAQILKQVCPKESIIARWGGDEFTVILPKTTDDEAKKIYNEIMSTCQESSSKQIILSISLGVSTKNNSDSDINDILRNAEDKMYTHKLVEGKSVRSTIISSLQKTLFEKNCETEEHAERMLQLSNIFTINSGLSQYEMDEMRLLTVLHDVGKIGIADYILNKPGKLTDDEWREMKKHSEIGYRIAQSTPELAHISELILTHHERWDGKGYPQGLKGEQIPKLARILSIIDTFDVMTHERPYKEATSAIEAIEEIKQCAGSQFDPFFVEDFLKIRELLSL